MTFEVENVSKLNDILNFKVKKDEFEISVSLKFGVSLQWESLRLEFPELGQISKRALRNLVNDAWVPKLIMG